jgi:uncharacterized protein YndB with AHSA1/START domain
MRLATDELNLTLVVSRRFAASPERVFDAWFDPNAVGAWLFATPGGISKHVEIDACVGGGFAIHEQRGDSLATHFGTYLEIVRPNRIVFTFGTERQESTTVVMVDIRPDSGGGGGLLTLTHRLDPEWAALDASIRAGWASILEGLARATGNVPDITAAHSIDARRDLRWRVGRHETGLGRRTPARRLSRKPMTTAARQPRDPSTSFHRRLQRRTS